MFEPRMEFKYHLAVAKRETCTWSHGPDDVVTDIPCFEFSGLIGQMTGYWAVIGWAPGDHIWWQGPGVKDGLQWTRICPDLTPGNWPPDTVQGTAHLYCNAQYVTVTSSSFVPGNLVKNADAGCFCELPARDKVNFISAIINTFYSLSLGQIVLIPFYWDRKYFNYFLQVRRTENGLEPCSWILQDTKTSWFIIFPRVGLFPFLITVNWGWSRILI